MWHTIGFLAESRRVCPAKLEAFALENEEKYGIVVERGRVEVNTWHVDALVADFKNIQPGSPGTISSEVNNAQNR